MVTLKNDDQGFASSNHTGTFFFYQSKVEYCVILFVYLFDWFDSLRLTNNLSVKNGRSSWVKQY